MLNQDRLSKNANFITVNKDNHKLHQNKLPHKYITKVIQKTTDDKSNTFKINLQSKYKSTEESDNWDNKHKYDCNNDISIQDSQMLDIDKIIKRESMRESILVINKGTSIVVDKPEGQKNRPRAGIRQGIQDLSSSITFDNEHEYKNKSQNDKNYHNSNPKV